MKKMASRQLFFLVASIAISSVLAANFGTAPNYFGQLYTTVGGPRGMMLDDAGDILVVSTSSNTIVAIYDTPNGDGSVNVCRTTIVNSAGLGLNHGITYFQGYLYASSATTVYRWPYAPGQRTLITTQPQTVISGIPNGGHTTRTIIFDSQGLLYVSVGSAGNIDQNSDRARIRRFNLSTGLPITFNTGLVYADGLRNEVGLDFDGAGVLWGVENSGDNLNRPDLGGDIHNGNPAEELNRFNREIGTHYGYPYCFSTDSLPGYATGTQFAWPSFMNDGVHTDAWCRDLSNNQPPALSMAAHNAPLGIEFYKGLNCSSSVGAFPCSSQGDAFIAFHGSWNSDIRVGYRVRQYVFNNLLPTGQSIDIIYEPNTSSCSNCLRPVNAIFDKDGHLVVSADSSGEIFRVYFNANPPTVTQNSCS